MMDNDRTQPRRRLRLAPAQRVPQILDAALQEFSRRGFTAARMDDIAQRCGLSKGGLYAHFDSKDAIFKALLDRSLNRTDWAQMPQLAAVADTRAVAEWTVDRLHAALLAPEVITLVRLLIPERERVPLRLLIPERERVPLRVDEWKKLTQQHTQQVMAVIHHNLEASGRKDTVLARHPWLVLSPIVHVLLWHTVFGEGAESDPHYRQAHIDMLCELLA
jgi:AcrR family transcriptional regulator